METIEELALENKLLKEKIKHLEAELNSYRYDFLTGFKLSKDFNDLFNKYKLNNRNFYLTLVDINGLHFVNEQQGYLAGNSLIKRVARYLVDNFDGCIFRIGGDEFAILSANKPTVPATDDFVYASTYSKDFKNTREMFKGTDKLIKKAKNELYIKTGKERRKR